MLRKSYEIRACLGCIERPYQDCDGKDGERQTDRDEDNKDHQGETGKGDKLRMCSFIQSPRAESDRQGSNFCNLVLGAKF